MRWKRPDRNSAGSTVQGVFVAAMTSTPLLSRNVLSSSERNAAIKAGAASLCADPALERQEIEIVEKQDCRRLGARLVEKHAQAFFGVARIFIDDFLRIDRQEARVAFARRRPGDQRLAAAGRAVKQADCRPAFGDSARTG